jgi:ubiquinone/menaquinone biosynthesis C-methylase UbiE
MKKNNADCLADGFRAVDSQKQIAKFVDCLGFLDSLPSFQKYKSAMTATLGIQFGDTLVDFGSGLGFDVNRIAALVGASGKSIGVDWSHHLVGEAIRRAADFGISSLFLVADIHRSPFDDCIANRCRIDRTLQHVESPEKVLREMFRILKPGGCMVAAEPDWGTFTLGDDDRTIVRQIAQIWSDKFRNGWVGRFLFGWFKQLGLKSVTLTGHLLMVEGLDAVDKVFDLRGTIELAASTGNSSAVQNWLRKLEGRDQTWPILGTVTLFMVSGTK